MQTECLATPSKARMTCAAKSRKAHLRFMIMNIASRRLCPLAVALCLIAIAIAACSKDEDTKEAHLSRANEYFAAGQYDKAETEYRDVLRLAPDDPTAQHQLGLLYQDQGQYAQAYPLLKKSAELAPDDLEVQLKLGITSDALHQDKVAREAALRVLDKQPGHEQALVLLANTALGLNDIDEMRKYVEGLRAKDKDRTGYHLAYALFDLRQNDQSSAESEIKDALALDPKSAGALTAMANIYWSRNDLPAAEREFKAAADLSPPRSPMWLRYADFKRRTGAVKEAKEILQGVLQKAPDYLPAQAALMTIACTERGDDCAERVRAVLARDPNNVDALYQDGLISLDKGDAAKAMRVFEYLSNNTQNPQVRYQLARAYLLYAKSATPAALGRQAIEEAERSLSEAVKLDPHADPAVLLLAELKIRKGSPAAAVDLLQPLIKEQSQIAQAYYLLASAYLAQQQSNQALAVYRRMTELFPKDPQPPFLIGRMLMAQQSSDARQQFEKSLQIAPDYLPATEMLVQLDLAAKQYAPALARVQKFIDKDPKQAQAWAIRGTIYMAQRDFVHAEPDLLKAIELDPKLEPAYLLLAQLYVASNKPDQAVEKLSAFLDQNKDEPAKTVPALMQLAMIQHGLKHFDATRDAYEKVLAVAPNFAPALNNLAVLYSDNLSRLDNAYDLAKKARETDPNDPQIADTLGWTLYKKGDYANALPLLQESAGKVPSAPAIQFHLAMTQYMMGAEEPARTALQQVAQATADFPGKDDARRRLAVLAIDVKTANPADARTELENYLRGQPNDPQALLRLGELQERDGALDQATATYQKIIDSDPQFAPAMRQLALLYSQRPSDDDKAYDLAIKAHQAYPGDPDIARVLGILNYRRGYYPQSTELLNKAAVKQSDNAELFYYLGEADYRLKQWGACDDALKRALSLNLSPKLADQANSTLAECSTQRNRSDGIASYQSGDYAKSAELLKTAAANHKDDAELLFYLGQSYHQLKQSNECKDTLQRALNLSLSPQLANEAKHALEDCSQTSSQ
jgi:tetratricopeptide (TPR) repeat protein